MTRAKEYSEAKTYYVRAVTKDPDDFKANYNYGLLLIASQDLKGAQQRFEAACRAEPSEMVAWQQYIRTSLQLKDYENTLQGSEVVLSVTPNSPFALSAAAIACAETGRREEAKGFMARLKEINTERWQKIIDSNERLRDLVE